MWKPSKPDRQEPISSSELWEAFQAGQKAGFRPASEDVKRILAWGVDWQVDFLSGSLIVPEGYQALKLYLENLYDNVNRITATRSSADAHPNYMISFPNMWEDAQGNMPPAFTEILPDDVRSGTWRPTYDPVWQLKYVFALTHHNKKLRIWPFHCLDGTYGATLAPAWIEFLHYWGGARRGIIEIAHKGRFWGSEMYAPQKALVIHPQDPEAELTYLYNEIEVADEIWPGGVAENFCFDEWNRANIEEFGSRGKQNILSKFKMNRDFTAPIEYPGFENDLRAMYTLYAQNGLLVEGAQQFLN